MYLFRLFVAVYLGLLSGGERAFADSDSKSDLDSPKVYPTLGSTPNSREPNQAFFPVVEATAQPSTPLVVGVDHSIQQGQSDPVDRFSTVSSERSQKKLNQICNGPSMTWLKDCKAPSN